LPVLFSFSALINALNHFYAPNKTMNIINERIPLKVIAEHRYFFSVLARAKGKKKLLAYAFLALTASNFVYFFTEPAQAGFLFDDLTGAGRAIGNSIQGSAYKIIVGIYNGKFGILDWLSKSCLFFATPVAAVGIMQALEEKESEHPMPKRVFYGVLALVVCLSQGGFIMGQLYLFMYELFEGFAKGMDSRMSIYSAIESGKGFLSANATLSASFAECHKFVGQEQVTCISKATDNAMTTLSDLQKSYGPMDWIKGRMDAIQKIATDIVSPNGQKVSVAANLFFMFVQPVAETAAAAHATASIVMMSVVYTITMAFLGLGGPVAMLASLLAPGLQSAWVLWVISVFSVWFWHTSYLAVMWFLSQLLLSASNSNFVATDWFSMSAQWMAPTLTGAACGVGGMAVFQGVTRSVNEAAELVARAASIAAKAAVGAATGGLSGAATSVAMSSGGGGGGGGSSAAPPQGMSTPPVATQY
jgi:hypothetical protein